MTPKSVFLQRKFLFGDWFRLFSFINGKMQIKTHQKQNQQFQMVSFAEVLYEATEQYKFYAGIDGGVK